MSDAYTRAGVNIDAAAETKKIIGKLARTTFGPEVLGGIGFFGGLYEFKGYRQPVLVSSVDGVGTKLKIAAALDKYDTVGFDIVNHCVNDIFTGGASPLFFLDYIAMGKLEPATVGSIAQGLAAACREVGCALIGGETAEMPGIYAIGDCDLVGFVIGVVEKDWILQGETISEGDVILGLPSSGLHTNGYSLARRIFGDRRQDLETYYPELGRTVGEALLEPHLCYYRTLKPHLPAIKGMAHITGGGLIDNVPRTLPDGLGARFHRGSWPVPAIFNLMMARGDVDADEMYRVFNMGLGMVVICSPDDAGRLAQAVPEAVPVGEIVPWSERPRVIID